MKVFILGIAGELGSSFAKLCLKRGYEVSGLDIVRIHEAWRISDIIDEINYLWKASHDLVPSDIRGYDLILDAAAQPDRPLGIQSPLYTLFENLMGPLRLLECVRRLDDNEKPILIYPSSGTIFLGVPPSEQPITERTKPRPTNPYSWSKLACEELYRTYHIAFNIPIIITRSGSVYGPGMRTDQYIAKFIINALRGKDIIVRSPHATRTPTYISDILSFYNTLLDVIEDDTERVIGITIHGVGNADNRDFENIEIARMIRELTNADIEIIEGDYEPGEMINGKPVRQWEVPDLAKKLLGWSPRVSVRDGIRRTINWFREVGYES